MKYVIYVKGVKSAETFASATEACLFALLWINPHTTDWDWGFSR